MRKLLLVFALLAVPFALFIGCNMRSNPTAASAVKAADVTPVATCVLYSDNFSANTLGNYNYFCTTTQGVKTAANVGYTITGGTLENIGPGGVAVLNSPFFNPANTSYTVEANFELNSTQNNRGIFGLAFEAGVNYSFYSFQWSYDGSASGGTPDWELEKNNGAPNTGAYLDETTGLPYILGSTVHLKVVVNGNNFKCYANFNDGAGDRLFFNDIDTNAPLTDGSVGLRTYGITNPMVAKINNFTVSSCSPVLTATPGGPTSTPTVVCGGSSGGSGPICPNSYLNWTILAPMPTGRQELAAGVDNGILYAVGGYGNSGILNTVEAYDPATNSWSTKVPMPTARQGLAVGVVNGILYALGGIGIAHGGGSGSVYLNTVEAYNPATNSWSTMAPMPTARYGLSVAVMNGILYAVGGWNFSSGLLNTVETYDPATNSWSTKAFMPTARSNTAAGVLDGILYVAGGSSSSLEAYNPCTNSWTTGLPGLPTPMGYPAGGVMNGQFYLADGVTVEFYNPSTNSWTSQATNPTARQSLAGGVINNVFYLVGGWSGNNLATNEGGALVCGFTPTPTVTPTPTCAYSDNFSADTLGNYNYSSTTDPSANTAASVGFVLAGGTLENT
ncbi:MAG TPA: kelch repeat-containing protein, partial [bacterium]|nr:kelch repeat-containing protein [bacterium]